MSGLKSELQAVRETRQHWRTHHHHESRCDICRLWGAYIRGDERLLDELAGGGGEAADAARAIRSEWGEAGWTANDL